MHPDLTVVKQGTFLYADTVVCDIRIVKTNIRHGSGDYEDPPEIADDSAGEFYDVEFGSTTQRGVYLSSIRGLISLDQALRAAEQAPGIGATLRWSE
jgi:hypothetical protein